MDKIEDRLSYWARKLLRIEEEVKREKLNLKKEKDIKPNDI